MTNSIKHAIREFNILGWLKKDPDDEIFKSVGGAQRAMCLHAIKLLEVFSNEGHSGSTAPYAVDLFKKLAMFEILSPLTGEDNEWNDVSEHMNESFGGFFQNNRAGNIFKNSTGKAYDCHAIVFKERSGSCYTSRNSSIDITFPYTPKVKYVPSRYEIFYTIKNKIKKLFSKVV